MTQRILFIDVETRPALAWVWSQRADYIPLDMVEQPSRMVCFAAKFLDDKRTQFYSEWDDGSEAMVANLWRLLDEADTVVSYNGKRFDEEWFRTEVKLHGLTPWSPFHSVDLYQQTRKFRLFSHKLQHVSTFLLKLEGKVQTGGFGLWRQVIDDMQAELGIIRKFDDKQVAKARKLMTTYNKQDVDLMPEMWVSLLPWMKLPNQNLFVTTEDGRPVCPKCGVEGSLEKRGFEHTRQSTFQRFLCKVEKGGCGGWSRDTRRVDTVSLVEVSR